MAYDTLESAQERILELEGELDDVKTERDSLSSDNEKLKTETENLRTLNQKYFNRLIAQDDKTDDTGSEGEDDIPSCVDLAKSIKI